MPFVNSLGACSVEIISAGNSIDVIWTRYDASINAQKRGSFVHTPLDADTWATVKADITTKITNENGLIPT